MISNVNTVILRSIPMDKDLKRYFISKWNWLRTHNGDDFAVETFKSLRTALIAYRSDPHRSLRVDKHLANLPIRKNGWARKLIMYTDSHPHLVFNFLKLYTSFPEPLTTVEEAERQMEESLSTINSDDNVPWFLDSWVSHFVEREYPLRFDEYKNLQFFGHIILDHNSSYDIRKKSKDSMLRLLWSYARHHSYEQYREYWYLWNRRFRKVSFTEEQSMHHMAEKPPVPEVYADFNVESASADSDLAQFIYWIKANGIGGYGFKPSVFNLDDLNFMMHPLDRRVSTLVHQLGKPGFLDDVSFPMKPENFVGYIHHIPKSGTTERRSIAVPNRYVQSAMIPGYRFLERFVRRLPNDATFDQGRFDMYIQNRVNNPNLYIGSVDLSKATDNLPLNWGRRVIEALKGHNSVTKTSIDLFFKTAISPWANGTTSGRWSKGQPLGTLPSFMTLALTHNLFLESLAFSLGLSHSPYRVLGDDVVISNKKLRKSYIREMRNRSIPLSLHKSFEGNLTEFAGKTYVRNMRAFYTPDHGPISWNSLFDWQRAAGIMIPYNHLPTDFKNRMLKMADTLGLPRGIVSLAYDIALRAEVTAKGSSVVVDDSYLETYYFLAEDRIEMDPKEFYSGISRISGHPIQLGDTAFAEKDGYFLRFRKVLPDWFKTKFRPVETDKVVFTALKTVKTIKGYQ